MEIAWAIGAAAGLSTLAGFRAFLPMAVFLLMSSQGWFWGFKLEGALFDFLQSPPAIVVLLLLAIAEVLLSRVAALRSMERVLRVAASALAGVLLFTVAISGEFTGAIHFAGIPLGLGLAALGIYVYRGLLLAGEGKDPGPALDVSVLLLSAIVMGFPPAGYLFGLATVWLALRVRRLKKMKYKGLRVLA